MNIKSLCFIPLFLTWITITAQSTIQTEVLVVGGSASGIAAGIQSARMGVRTIIAEPTTWVGGMITAAGVSAFDGNHNMPSGIFGEFRTNLYKVYGGANKVATGWVSNTQFEPHIGDSIFKSMAAAETRLKILYQLQFQQVIQKNGVIIGARFINKMDGKMISIKAKQVIDATELGDLLANAGVGYDLGMEASAVTGEDVLVSESNNIVQDITYIAILKDYGLGKDCTIVKPVGYDPAEFDGACTDYYFNKRLPKPSVDATKMLNYGRLPNNKYMINWPGNGNDIYLNIVEMSKADREKELLKAKQQTLRFVYFIQHQLGFKNLGFANDEYPTEDRFPLIPYHRESRRAKGLVRFNIKHISTPFNTEQPLYRTGIAVGDYPVDHHHKKNTLAPQHLGFYPIPSFNIPLGALIPKYAKGLILAEKNISVSNIVNGTTRLQAIALLIGEAAGTLAALAVQQKTDAASVPVRKVQSALLKSNAYLMPYFDTPLTHPHFAAVQRIGATGILKGQGIPHHWANKTLFNPDSLVLSEMLEKSVFPFIGNYAIRDKKYFYQRDAVALLQQFIIVYPSILVGLKWNSTSENSLMELLQVLWPQWKIGEYDVLKPLTRLQLAVILDSVVNPFSLMDVDHSGNFILRISK